MIVLDKRESTTLGSDGAGSIVIGPSRYREEWVITRMSTDGNSATEPTLNVYRGAATSVASLVDTTRRGNAAVSEIDNTLILHAGEILTARYTGGTAGAVMGFHVEGEIRGIS